MRGIITVFLFFIIWGAQSQTTSEKLGAVSTNFKITSASLPLDVTSQIVLKKNVTTHYDDDNDNEYALYERYFFQFISENKLVVTNRSDIKDEVLFKANHKFYSNGYFVRLFDEKGSVIYEFTRERKDVFGRDYNLGKGGYYTYSIDLRGFPLILLDQVKRIDVQIIK